MVVIVALMVVHVIMVMSMVVTLVVMRVVVVVTMVMVVVARVTGNSNNGRLPIVKANVQLTQLTFESSKLNGQRGITSAHACFNFFFNAHQ